MLKFGGFEVGGFRRNDQKPVIVYLEPWLAYNIIWCKF